MRKVTGNLESRTSGVGPGQRSRFLVLTKRSAASGDENDYHFAFPATLKKAMWYAGFKIVVSSFVWPCLHLIFVSSPKTSWRSYHIDDYQRRNKSSADGTRLSALSLRFVKHTSEVEDSVSKFITLSHHMFIFNLHSQLFLRISGNHVCYIKTRPNVKFPLYLKKAGLASRNIVHLQKTFYVVSVSTSIFFILFVKPIRSLHWSDVYQQDYRSGCLLKHFIVRFVFKVFSKWYLFWKLAGLSCRRSVS